MSLRVNNTRIIIENSDGTEKFDSSHKLVHKRFSYEWTTTSGIRFGNIGGFLFDTQEIGLNYEMEPKDFAIVYVTPISDTYTNGTVSSTLTGSEIQLNFPLLTNFQHSTTSAVITAYDVLSAVVFGGQTWGGNKIKATLKISHIGHYTGPFDASDDPYKGRVHRRSASSAVMLKFRVVIYSHQ
jgi:hypothetical protein